MSLGKYEGRYVRMVDVDGKEYVGQAVCFFPPDENDNGEESLAVQTGPTMIYELYQSEIKSIEVVKPKIVVG